MKVVTPEEMIQMERQTMSDLSFSEELLMERAGMSVARTVVSLFPSVSKVVALAGKGNNGGDALVAIRDLHSRGIAVSAVLISPENECGPSVLREISRLKFLGVDVDSVVSARSWHRISHADLLIDGILGTGFHGSLSPDLLEHVGRVNQSGKKVVAVDIPSGVDGLSAGVSPEAIKATLTVTFALPKWGILADPGHRYTGKIVVSDIGIPPALLKSGSAMVLTPKEAAGWLPEREPFIHKGVAGHVAVWGGGEGKRGAAELAALGALRSGSGLATVLFLENEREIVPRNPEIMVDLSKFPFSDLLGKVDVLAVGPGLEAGRLPISSVKFLLDEFHGPIVADAGVFDLFKGDIGQIVRSNSKPLVLTPHPGELSRFLDRSVPEILSRAKELALETAFRTKAVVLLKGWRTIIAGPSGELAVNLTGAPNMATAGMGDLLTGIISSLMGQGLSPFRAAVLGAHLHGVAGELAWKSGKTRGLLAHELSEWLPFAFTKISGSRLDPGVQDTLLYEPLERNPE
ncbi:MAG: NAD(P)H-hydrate dehydratase [Leptospirales bacterium]